MKKIALIAAMSLAALVSCTKNETAPSVTDQQEITFASPVVGVSTKVPTYGLLSGAYPTTQTFNVWAWYSKEDTYDGNGVKYMTDVTVEYDSKNFNDAEAENGAWAPNPTYYWPKNGKLTFDAYSPTELNTKATVACTASAGLTIENYTVPTTLEQQIDVLYSERAADKVSTSFSAGTYEGVDIVFNHALAAVAFTIKQSEAYPAGTIKVKDIVIKALSNGNFAHNITYPAGTAVAAPAWTNPKTPAEYKALACADYANSLQPVNAEGAAGATVLVLPQAFSATNDVTITVNYYIKNQNEDALLQEAVFHLNEPANQSGEYQADQSPVNVNKWEMGKKYTYNLTIGLDDIFFAPRITEWEKVNVNLPEIK